MTKSEKIIQANELFVSEFSIPDSVRPLIEKCIKKWDTKRNKKGQLEASTIYDMVNTPRSLSDDLRRETFINSKGKIAEYLIAEERNKRLAGHIRMINIPYQRRLISMRARHWFTMVNPHSTSKVDLIDVWRGVETRETYVVALGDSKNSGNVYFVLNEYEKCIKRNVPLIDVSGVITDAEQIRKLKDKTKTRLANLNKRAIQKSKSGRNELLLCSKMGADDVLIMKKNLLKAWVRQQPFDKRSNYKKGGKFQYKEVFEDLRKYGVRSKMTLSWDSYSRMESQRQKIYRIVASQRKRKIQTPVEADNEIHPQETKRWDDYSHLTSQIKGTNEKDFKNEGNSSSAKNRNEEKLSLDNIDPKIISPFDPGHYFWEILWNDPEAMEMLLHLVGKGGEIVAGRVGKSLDRVYEKFSAPRQNRSPSQLDSSSNTSKNAAYVGIGQGIGKSPHERQPHRVTLKHPRYKNMRGQTIVRKGSNINANKDK